MEISQPLEELDWIPRPKILALRRLGITTVEHLLTHFPRRHEDRSAFPEFPRDESDVPICLSGEVIKTSLRRFGGWKKIFEATLQELNANALSQPLICRWFNLHYVQKMIATGQQLVVFGKPRLRGKRICMDHPEFEVIENNEERSIQLRRITPIYPATEGLSQRALRSMIYRLLQELDTEPIEPLLPENLKNGDRGEAIRAIHFPETWQSLNVAREHLVLSEFFAMQMLIASRRTDSHARVSAAHCGRGELMQKFLHALPFELTTAQKKVIDEQHKFGVAQRARLTSREPTPDVLVMTATPIPRTVTMTVYGDLDVSVLDEMPRGRGKVVTAVRDSSKLGEVLTFFRTQLEAGRQLYVVYPLIEESEKLEAKAAAAEYGRWHERLHPYSCELLHGRIPGPEKQEIMERFRRGETKVLISTTVIEVGVDVSNANVMLIENAERFGLAQLHQLRGRIGRGEHKSYCILLTSEPSSEVAAKLAVLEKTSDGFEVAEADWELRGPGDLLGTAQSGLPALKIGNLRRDAELMRRARRAAMSIFAVDPTLESPQNQRFQQ